MYSAYVSEQLSVVCLPSWRHEVERHTDPVPYTDLAGSPSSLLADALRAELPWDVLIGTRSWIRLRVGYIDLGCRSGRRSRATARDCIFCRSGTSAAVYHTLGRCDHWATQRAVLLEALGLDRGAHPGFLTRTFLRISPESTAFPAAVRWAVDIEKQAAAFWRKNR